MLISTPGGSPDGARGSKTIERLDLRVGRWEKLVPELAVGRAYCAAAFGASGLLYVMGGQDFEEEDDEDRPVTDEILDVRRPDRWRVSSVEVEEEMVDLGAVFCLM